MKSVSDLINIYLENVTPYQEVNYSGRGIVTSVYKKVLPDAWILLSELKRLGVNLPVEVFYKHGELSDQDIKLLKKTGASAKFIELNVPVESYALKPFFIKNSSFNEVLWIDSDNFPIANPEYLFSVPEYVSKGSLFWRDYRNPRLTPEIFSIFGIPRNDSEEFETGQLLINKKKCWLELCVTEFYNQNSNYFYRFVHGDKDTFRMAWIWVFVNKYGKKVRSSWFHHNQDELVPYGFVPYGPFSMGNPYPGGFGGGGCVMTQRDYEGKPLFNHRTLSKFSINKENEFQRDVINEEIYHEHFRQYVRTFKELGAGLPDACD